jgi:hypothetical protein
MTFPMLAEFALRLACALAGLLLATPWRLVPAKFFRTHCLVILGLLVLAGLDASRAGVRGPWLYAVVAAAVLAYLAAVAWGVGLPTIGNPLTILIAVGCLVLLAGESYGATSSSRAALEVCGRIASAFLMGSTLTAMLLGHYYLTAPAMSIEPLKRVVLCMGAGIVVRATLALTCLAIWLTGSPRSATLSSLFLAVRFGVGLVGPAVATWMTWQTVQIRSTQSATGILYIAMTLVLFGELTAMVLFHDSGVMF